LNKKAGETRLSLFVKGRTMARAWKILLLVIVTSALYVPFLSNPPVFDDIPFFRDDETTGVKPVEQFQYSHFSLRSLPYSSLAWGWTSLGPDMVHFRIENLLLHIAVCVALFFFICRLLVLVAPSIVTTSNKGNIEWLALASTILFALHPVSVYAVGYLVQRSMLMATLFSLLAMLAWMRGHEDGKKWWLWVAVFFYYHAVFSKEHAVMLPFAFFALTVLLYEDWKVRVRQYWLQFLALAMISLFVVAAVKGIIGTTYEFNAAEMLDASDVTANHQRSVLTQSWLFFKYVVLWVLPNPRWMSADMREPFATSMVSIYLVALFLFLAWGGLAIKMLCKRGRIGLIGFAMLFPWLMFMTEFATIRIQEIFVLYRSYIWVAAAFVALPVLLSYLDKKMAAALVAASAIAFVPMSLDRLASLSLPVLLWSDAEKLVQDRPDVPGAYRIYYNLGTEFVKLDMLDVGMGYFNKAVEINPDWPFTYNNIGVVYLKTEQWQKALEAFNHSIDLVDRKFQGKTYARNFLGRAVAYEQLGKVSDAQADYRVACRYANMGCEKIINQQAKK